MQSLLRVMGYYSFDGKCTRWPLALQLVLCDIRSPEQRYAGVIV